MGRRPKAEKEESSGATINRVLSDFLNDKENADKHHNFEEEVDYKVSTGSLISMEVMLFFSAVSILFLTYI